MTTNKLLSLAVVACLLSIVTSLGFGLGKNDSAFVFLAFGLAVYTVSWIVDGVVRRKRLHDWYATEGTIESCDDEGCYKRTQSYRCAYVYRPDATRQGGTFLIFEPSKDCDDRLDQIRKELVGLTVRVRYDPKDYSRCIVEDKQVMDWDVVND